MTDSALVIAGIVASLLCFGLGWGVAHGRLARRHGAELARVRRDLEVTARSAQVERQRVAHLARQLAASQEAASAAESRQARLKDQCTMLLGRLRELDRWTAPIRGALGDAFADHFGTLKEEIREHQRLLTLKDRVNLELRDQLAETRLRFERLRTESEMRDRELERARARIGELSAAVEAVKDARPGDTGPPHGATARPPSDAGALLGGLDAGPGDDLAPPDTLRWKTVMATATRDQEFEMLMRWQTKLEERLSELENLKVKLFRVYSDAPGGGDGTGPRSSGAPGGAPGRGASGPGP